MHTNVENIRTHLITTKYFEHKIGCSLLLLNVCHCQLRWYFDIECCFPIAKWLIKAVQFTMVSIWSRRVFRYVHFIKQQQKWKRIRFFSQRKFYAMLAGYQSYGEADTCRELVRVTNFQYIWCWAHFFIVKIICVL